MRKRVTQAQEPGTNPSLHSPQRLPELGGDLTVSEPGKVGELDQLPLLGPELLEGTPHMGMSFGVHTGFLRPGDV